MSRATDAILDELHAITAEGMTEELRRNLQRARQPKTIMVENKSVPNPDWEPLSPKLLGVIRAFLKDNGIDAPASSPRFNSLIDELKGIDVNDPALAN